MPRKDAHELAAMRKRLGGQRGKQWWRSLEELAGSEAFQAYLSRQFPQQHNLLSQGTSRRQFLQLMGASLALAGLSGCSEEPADAIVPYVQTPEEIVPGKPLYYATAAAVAGNVLGLLVESHEGRPTKIEGNPDHPASRGASDAFTQAAILGLYDPDRSQTAYRRNQIATSRNFAENLAAERDSLLQNQGAGLRILIEPVLSPTLADQLNRLAEAFPEMRLHVWDPVRCGQREAALELAFGEEAATLAPVYRLDMADVVLSLDADFLASGWYPVRYADDFMHGRRLPADRAGRWTMNRLYAVQTTPSLTGAKADHCLSRHLAQLEAFAFDLAEQLGVQVQRPPGLPPSEVPQRWLQAVAEDLRRERLSDDQAALIVAGEHLPPRIQALAAAMNQQLGAIGTTVTYYPQPLRNLKAAQGTGNNPVQSLRSLVEAMEAGDVQTLLIIGGNPVYDAPADIDFAGALVQVPFSCHLSLYRDETSRRCLWHVPRNHFLEGWSDLVAEDGTASIVQPLLEPLYEGWTVHQLLAHLLGEADRTDYEIVRAYWRQRSGTDDFERWWYETLHRGTVEGSTGEPQSVTLRSDFATALSEAQNNSTAQAESTAGQANNTSGSGAYEVVIRPDPCVWDGRFANNAWLQELPKPLTKLTWDNAALLSPQDAEAAGLTTGDLVELSAGSRTLQVPVLLLPGQPPRTITVTLGYGRRNAGRVGSRQGFDVYPFRTSDALWFVHGVQLRKLGTKYPLATTVHHHLIDPKELEERHIIREGTLSELNAQPRHPHFVHPGHAVWQARPWKRGEANGNGHHGEDGHAPPVPTAYPEWDYSDDLEQHRYKWAMVIDQNACTGCNACVVACQAENNIPVVGKEEVIRGREMHWLRIDAYYAGDAANPIGPSFQPLPCMHCENAPCEVVCPVAATTHSKEGLNEMTYNRCVGTRYCSNNCPYKVRRFNYFNYTGDLRELPVLQLLQNPDVTIRTTGVMEKCTYCVQRLNAARIEAKMAALDGGQHAGQASGQRGDSSPDNAAQNGANQNSTTPHQAAHGISVQTACQQVCPTRAITFGDLNTPSSPVSEARNHPLNYELLGELNTRPRTTYWAIVRNPNPSLIDEANEEAT